MIMDNIKKGVIKVSYICAAKILSDLFTKQLGINKF